MNIKIYLSGIFCLYFFLSLFGYGSDNDTFGMIKSGQNLFLNGVYVSSRFQGALIPEIIIGATSLLGSFYLSNFISVILGILSLYFFYSILTRCLEKEKSLFATVLVSLNPFYILASTTSMDYIYSIFFILWGLIFLDKKYFYFASLIFAAAISSRISNSLIVLIIYVYFIYVSFFVYKKQGQAISFFLSGALGGLIILLLLIPVFVTNDYSLSFLSYSIGDWDLFGYISRFGYKNIALYGVIPFLLIVFLFVKFFKKRFLNLEVYFTILVIFLQELLFLKVPIEISYLLPLIFITFGLLSYMVEKKNLIILFLVILLNNFITLDVVEIKYHPETAEAIDSEVGIYLKSGVIMQDLEKREPAYSRYKENILSE